MDFTSPCFSGECELCPSCCDAEPKSDEPESLQRAEDLKKFMGNRLDDELNHYNKSLKKIMKGAAYRNPSDIGFLKEKITYGDKLGYNKYHLIQESHSAVCDDQLCKVFFVSAHDNQKMMFYPNLPIYTRVSDNGHQLCAVCISR